MKKVKTPKSKIIAAALFALLIIGAVAFIFFNSSKTGPESASDSEVITKFVMDLLGRLGVTCDKAALTVIIRKCAHFAEYFLLSALIFSALHYFTKNNYIPFVSVPVCFCVALVDEFVFQKMSAGRGPMFKDVLIDTGGALTAAIIIFVIIILKQRSKRRKKAIITGR